MPYSESLIKLSPLSRALIFSLALLAAMPLLSAFQSWEKPPQPPSSGQLKALTVHPRDPQKIIVASDHQIFEGPKEGPWKNLGDLGRFGHKIHRILYWDACPDSLFVLTENSLLEGGLQTREWREVYRGKTGREKFVYAFAVSPFDPAHWYLGTTEGLLESDDRGKTWFRFSSFTGGPVTILRFIGNDLFAATPERFFISKDGASFKTLLGRGGNGEFSSLEEDAGPEEAGTETENVSFDFRDVAGTDGSSSHLWLATGKGVFESRDGAASWHLLAQSGLRSTNIEQLVYSGKNRRLFAVTSRGVYLYLPQSRRWEELFQGLDRPEIRGLALWGQNEEMLLAVTAGGFITYPVSPEAIVQPPVEILASGKFILLRRLFSLEPDAREIHRAVIRFANLGNGKIKRWHRESRLRALVPSLSVGRDVSRDLNIDIDRGSTTDPDKFIYGPEETGRNVSADVRWDLGDLIFNGSQTSIDSREKLMVELRNDFLSEATRIYYERRRLQTEIVFTPAASGLEHLERLNRMDELTSLLDAMTDGCLSKRLEEIYRQNPELEKLWEYQASNTNEHE